MPDSTRAPLRVPSQPLPGDLMLLTLSLLAIRFSDGLAASDPGGWCDPNGFVNQSASTSTSFGAGGSVTVAGPVGTAQSFTFTVGEQTALVGGRLLLRVPWVLTTQAADAAARGQIRATLTINGTTIGTAVGAIRNLNSANNTRWTEIMCLDLSPAQILTPGTEITVTFQPIVTTISATIGDTMTTTLEHNPSVPVSQLALDFMNAGGGL